MDEESNTPTALMKIYGDFDARVKTASRRTGESFRRHHSGSLLSSNVKVGETNVLGRKTSSSALPRGRLLFDEIDSPHNQSNRQKRTLEDPLDFDRYPKAMRTIDDSRSSSKAEIERMKMQLIQKDADIVSLEAEVKQAQAQVKKMEVELAKDRLIRESERENQVREIRTEKERNEDLKQKIKRLTEKKKYEKQYADTRLDLNTSIENNFQQVDQLMDEIDSLKEELFSLKSDFDEREARYKEEIVALQATNNELSDRGELETADDPEKLSELKSEIERMNGENILALQKIKKLESELQTTEDDRIQFRIMKNKLDQFSILEKEVVRLRSENELLRETEDNGQLMKEKIDNLKLDLSRTENMLSESRQKQEELLFVERTIKQWKGICWKLLETSEKEKYDYDNLGPDFLKAKIASLQQHSLSLTETVENYKSQCDQKSKQIEDLFCEQNELKQKIQSDKDNLTEQANLIKRFKRKLYLVSKERDSYKGVLGSYEHELTFNGAAFEKDRIAAVESTLTHFKETVEKLENLLAAAQSNKPNDVEMKLRAEISRLEEELQQGMHLQPGSQIPPDCKIVHFSNNPLAQAVEARSHEVENLRAEIVSLKARISLLEEGQTKDLTMLVGHKLEEGPSSEEVRQLQEQLQSAEIKKQRIIEAFKKTSQDFREVCYVLTGFRIDGLNDGKYRLSSVYAESPNDYLLFQRNSHSGECMLLETEYSTQEDIQKLIRLHLQQQNSIPVFLAAITSDLFSRVTFDSVMVDASVSGVVPPADHEEHEGPEEEDEDVEDVEDINEGDESGDGEEIEEEEEVLEEENFQNSGDDSDDNEEQDYSDQGGNDNDSDDSDDIVCID